MTQKEQITKKKQHKKRNRRNTGAFICSMVGTVLLIALILICLPLTVPKLFGYHVYTVVSGSMEPAIPTGSLIYIKEAEPENIEKGDVIAFYGARDSASIITHRVVENRVLMGEFVTKGDANQTEDMNPVPYENFIGTVVKSYPKLGNIAQILTSSSGKILAAAVIGAVVLLQIVAGLLEKGDKRKQK